MRKLRRLLLLVPLLVACDQADDCCGLPVDGLDGTEVPAMCYLAPSDCAGGRWSTVVSVYDGDTITLDDGSKVRLLGINAPEQPGKDSSQASALDSVTCGGPDAGDFLRALLLERSVCLLDSPLTGAKEDQYGRKLMYVFVDGVNVNLLLVATGHACTYDAFAELHCHEAFLAEEARADSEGLGIWGLCADLHVDPCARND